MITVSGESLVINVNLGRLALLQNILIDFMFVYKHKKQVAKNLDKGHCNVIKRSKKKIEILNEL